MPHALHRRPTALLPVGALAAASLASLVSAIPSAPAASATTAPSVRLTFNSSSPGIGQPIASVSNLGTLGDKVRVDVATANGGQALQVQGLAGSGRAAQLPAYDGSTTGPRAVVRIRNTGTTDYLSPGTAAFSWGADFQLDSLSSQSGSAGDNGDNLVQHGLTANQWKLQLDHRHAGCVASGSNGVVSATTTATVDSTSWYRTTCRRAVGGNGAVAGVTVGAPTVRHQHRELGARGVAQGRRGPRQRRGAKRRGGHVGRRQAEQHRRDRRDRLRPVQRHHRQHLLHPGLNGTRR